MERRRGRQDREQSVQSTINVLLIDDHAADRARIARVVTQDVAPVEVHEVSDHVGFYQALKEDRFDIVITEQELHWSSGLEVLTAVKSLRPGVPVIMVTRTDDDVAAAAAMREGVETFLTKTGDLEPRLRTSLRSALRRLEFEERIGSLEGRLQDLLERLHVGVFRASMSGTLLDTNTSFDRLVGTRKTDDDVPRTLADFFAEPAVFEEMNDRLAEHGQVRSFQARWVRADGEPVWVALSQTVERRSEGGRVVEGLVEDVTAIREAQDAVRQAGDDLRAVFEHSGVAIVVLEGDGTIAMVNSMFEDLAGLARMELEGVENWSRFMSIADGERMAERRRVLLAAPESGPRTGRFEFISRDGRSCLVNTTEAVLPGSDRTVVSLINITERQRVEDRLLHNVFHDGLTGIPNRISLMDRLENLLRDEADARDERMALLLLDVDHFKEVNDRFGQRIGDLLLRSVTGRLEGAVPDGATVARSGSDAFAVVFGVNRGDEDVQETAEAVASALADPFQFGDHTVRCTVSVGVAVSGGATAAADLFRDAEAAMYAARLRGGNQVVIFDSDMES